MSSSQEEISCRVDGFCCCSKHPEVFRGGRLLQDFNQWKIGTEIIVVDIDVKQRLYCVEIGPWNSDGGPIDVDIVPCDYVMLK